MFTFREMTYVNILDLLWRHFIIPVTNYVNGGFHLRKKLNGTKNSVSNKVIFSSENKNLLRTSIA